MSMEMNGSGNLECVESREVNTFQEIHPTGEQTIEESKAFWDEQFAESAEGAETQELIECYREYIDDLHRYSEFPETIPDVPFEVTDLKKTSPEERVMKREEFADVKAALKREWERVNGRPWPKYDHDVYSASDKQIRKAGTDYDAHHILPLCMGGNNEVSNITPYSVEVHYDKQGIHAPGSAFDRLVKLLGGMGS